MASVTYRCHRKLANGSYEVVHSETESGVVVRPNTETVEQTLKKTLRMKNAEDTVPGFHAKIDADTLQGKTLDEIGNFNAISSIGDISQNYLASPGDNWLPCDGRIIDSSLYPDLYNAIKIDSLYNAFDDISKWTKCGVGRFHGYGTFNRLYENSVNNALATVSAVTRIGNVVYFTKTYHSYFYGSGVYEISVSAIVISLDYGKTYKTFDIKPNVETTSSNHANHVGVTVIPFKGGAYLVKSDGGQGELTIEVAVITPDTTVLSFTRIYSYTQTIDSSARSSWLTIRHANIIDNKLVVVWSNDYCNGSETSLTLASTSVYDHSTNTVNTVNGITDIAYNQKSGYDYIVNTSYDSVTDYVFICTFNNKSDYMKLYKTKDFASYSLVYDMGSLASTISSPNKGVAMMAYDNHISIIGGVDYANYKGVQHIEIVDGSLYSHEGLALGDGSLKTDNHYIAVSHGGVFVYDESTHTFECKTLPKYNDIYEISCIDGVIFIDTESHGKVMFDMKNKRLPYIPGSYIKVK